MSIARACLTLALLVLALGACSGPLTDVTVELDGVTETLQAKVTCTTQPDGKVVIYAADPKSGGKRMVRILVSTQGRIMAYATGIRLEDVEAFTDDRDELVATKIGDTFTVSGRMPPVHGSLTLRPFQVEVACPGYVNAPRRDTVPAIGSP